jgi:penicillin-binding protein 1C
MFVLTAAVILVAAHVTPLPGWWHADETAPAHSSLCTVCDRDGGVLAVRRTDDEPYLPVRFEAVDPLLASATIAAEDRRFRQHPGVDLPAAARAAFQNARAGRRVSGGSTLTQQLVKLRLHPAGTRRDLPTKLREAWWALVLDAHLPKDRILEAYWNRAPYGATVRGVGAAALLYFGRGPQRLAPEEAALLAAIPRSPVRLDPRRNPEAARRARDRILARMGLAGPDLAADRERPLGLVAPPTRGARLAPHWLARVEATLPTAATVTLPIDPALQERAAAALGTALDALGARGADDAAAMVIHNPTGEVRAWVGSPDWSNPGHGQFDATRAPRQPGSALKPFTHALGFEAGLRPSSLLPDLPLEYGSGSGNFRPRNYTGEYHGPVRARAALANSWNAAAVALMFGLGPERLRLLLRAAGIATLEQPGNSYGVGLTLGDAEVTLADLTAAYACLARGGVWKPRVEVLEARGADGSLLRGPGALPDLDSGSGSNAGSNAGSIAGFDAAATPRAASRILNPRTAFLVTAVLADPLARARAFGLDGPFSFPFPVAIKTGTSSDWRDNWAFGYTSEWTVGTWVGRAGGGGMDRVSGTNGAILALREILFFLENGRPDRTFAEEFPPPPGMCERTICALSGMQAGPDCPETLNDWFHAEDPNGASCTWHRRIALDAVSGNLARPCTPEDRVRNVVFTVPDLPEPGAARIIPWNSEAFLLWCADRGWPVPPTASAACLCGDPGCAPIDAPPAPGLHAVIQDLTVTDPAARAHAILVADGAGATGVGSARPRTVGADSLGFARSRTSSLSAPSSPAWSSRSRSATRLVCRILRPVDGSIYALDPSLPRAQQQVALEASAGGRAVRWQVDGRNLGTSGPGARLFWPLTPGSHRIRATVGEFPAETDEVRIVVEEPS